MSIAFYLLDCGLFRKQWLLYDLLRSNSIIGEFDGCLFKYGPPVHYRQQDPYKQEVLTFLIWITKDAIED